MRRGDIWTLAGGKDYAGKPRPLLIVQDDSFDATDSITICAFTTDETEAPLFRLRVEPNERNGLRTTCRLMVDKITTVPKSKVGPRIGCLDEEDVLRLNQAVLVFLWLARSLRTVGARCARLTRPAAASTKHALQAGRRYATRCGLTPSCRFVAMDDRLGPPAGRPTNASRPMAKP